MDVFIDEVIRLVFAVATVVAVPLVTALVVRYVQKLGLTISAENQARLETAARQAILASEEWAAAKVKAKLPEKITSEAKLAHAVTHMVDQIPSVTTEQAEAIVTAQLPIVRKAFADFFAATRQAVETQ